MLFSSQRLDEGRLRGLASHLRYRMCLRTHSAPESKMVLDTPDAYLLPFLPGLEVADIGEEAPSWEGPEGATVPLRAAVGLVDLPSEQRTEVRLYAVDLGGGGLSILTGLPHVGGVAAKAGRDEVRRTVGHTRALLGRREEAFSALGLSSMADARRQRGRPELAEQDLADVFLLVDGWAVLRSDFEGLDLELEQIAVEGLNFGLHLVVTANRWVEMRSGLRDHIGSRLELRLNDAVESVLGRRVAETLPTDVPGRGLTAAGHHFQTAATEREDLEELPGRWKGPPASPVPVLPRVIEAAELPGAAGDANPGVPIGLDEVGLEPVHLDLTAGDPHFLALGDGESGKTNLLRLFARGLMARQDPGRARLTIVDYRRSLIDLSAEPHVHAYAANATMAAEAVSGLCSELEGRLPGAGTSREELLRGPSWSGARHYLLVDDYDLVPGASANPLTGLIDLLAQGRDVGLHLVLARRVGGMSSSVFETFMQRLLELRTPGLLMSGSPSEGQLLGGHRARSLPPGRGLLIRRDGEPGMVQTALAPEVEPGAEPLPARAASRRETSA